jgi:SAM-dependent methyltransferase
VDYSCPEKTGDWVVQQYPQSRVVRVTGERFFNLSKARNAGARAATGKILCFLDADVKIEGRLVDWLRGEVGGNTFGVCGKVAHGYSGALACSAETFARSGGYDENFEGWGGEDEDFRETLRLLGLTPVYFSEQYLKHIEHNDQARLANYRESTIAESSQRNIRYMHDKRHKYGEIWTPADHLRNKQFDEGLSGFLVKDFNMMRSVLDFGCGLGLYLGRLFAAGVPVCIGIEPVDMGTHLPKGVRQISHNIFTGKLDKRVYDAVLCLEVAEHIPRSLHNELFDFLCDSAGEYLVFSGAVPGQGGNGHVAERPLEEWVREITRRGFGLLADRTTAGRAACSIWWFRNNLMVFRRNRRKFLHKLDAVNLSQAKIFSIYMQNIPNEAIALQRAVFEKFGYCVTQVPWVGGHGEALDHLIKKRENGIIIFCDIDAIPLCRGVFEKMIFNVNNYGGLVGVAHQANHIDAFHQYPGPECLALSVETWNRLGRPSFRETARSDVAQELCRIGDDGGVAAVLMQPTAVTEPRWPLAGGWLGLGTVYENMLYHAFESRLSCDRFIKKCREVISSQSSSI